MLKGFFDERFATLLLIVAMFAGGVVFLANNAAQVAESNAHATASAEARILSENARATAVEATAQAPCYTSPSLGNTVPAIEGYSVTLTSVKGDKYSFLIETPFGETDEIIVWNLPDGEWLVQEEKNSLHVTESTGFNYMGQSPFPVFSVNVYTGIIVFKERCGYP